MHYPLAENDCTPPTPKWTLIPVVGQHWQLRQYESVFSCPLQPTHSGCVYSTEDWIVSTARQRDVPCSVWNRAENVAVVRLMNFCCFFLLQFLSNKCGGKKKPAGYSYTLGPGNPSRDEITVQPGWAAAHTHTNTHTHSHSLLMIESLCCCSVCRPLTHIHCDFMPERNIDMKMTPHKTKQLGVAVLTRDLHLSSSAVYLLRLQF